MNGDRLCEYIKENFNFESCAGETVYRLIENVVEYCEIFLRDSGKRADCLYWILEALGIERQEIVREAELECDGRKDQ